MISIVRVVNLGHISISSRAAYPSNDERKNGREVFFEEVIVKLQFEK